MKHCGSIEKACFPWKDKHWIRLPYVRKQLSSAIFPFLKDFELWAAFYPINTAQKLFTRLKDPLPLSEKSGVYSLRCKDCPATFIGQTGRKLSIRISEHKKLSTINGRKIIVR